MAKELYLIDTDVLIDFFRGNDAAKALIASHSQQIILSSIVVAELYAGVRGQQEQSALENFFSLFPISPVTSEIAKIGGLLKREFGKSHGIGLADAVIAATCEIENASLLTLNTKHYPMIRDLKPAYQK